MNPHPHKQGSELLLYWGWGGLKQWTPTPTNNAVNSYFARGGCDQNNEPPPSQTRQWTPALLGVGGAKTMNAHPHKQGSELLLYQEWMGQKQWTPTPTNKTVNSYFARGRWGQNNEPSPTQTRQWTSTFPGGGWGQKNEPPPPQTRQWSSTLPGVGGAKTMNPHPHKQGSDLLYQGWVGPKQTTPPPQTWQWSPT